MPAGRPRKTEPGMMVRRKMEVAADLRAQNMTWPVIASQVGYATGDSAEQNVAGRYPTLWAELFGAALEKHIRASVEPSAIKQQVEMMSFQNPADPTGAAKVRQAAAHSLLAHSAKLRAQHVEITAKRDPGKADEELMQRLIEAANVATAQLVGESEVVKMTLDETPAKRPSDSITDSQQAPEAPGSPNKAEPVIA